MVKQTSNQNAIMSEVPVSEEVLLT